MVKNHKITQLHLYQLFLAHINSFTHINESLTHWSTNFNSVEHTIAGSNRGRGGWETECGSNASFVSKKLKL